MSDALSDIAHDEERLERVGNYLAALYSILPHQRLMGLLTWFLLPDILIL